ncbi:unnamed protein product [Amoebophrya sp. A120]|nr:unnamed protein product [Amoebophrya sp. A120]|eukprot:GSA120T00003572001.1
MPFFESLQRVHGKYADCSLATKTGESVPATRCLLAVASPALERRIADLPPGGRIVLSEIETTTQLQELVRYSLGQKPIDYVAAQRIGHLYQITALASLPVPQITSPATQSSSTGAGPPRNGTIAGSKQGGAPGSGRRSETSGSSSKSASSRIGELTAKLNHWLSVASDTLEQYGISSSAMLNNGRGAAGGGSGSSGSRSSRSKQTAPGAPPPHKYKSPATVLQQQATGEVDPSYNDDSKILSKATQKKINSYGWNPDEPRSFVSSYWFLQALAFVLGISCWYHAWYYNLERGGLFMDDVMIKRNLNVVDPQFDWDRLIRTDYWGLEMFDPQVWTHKSFRPVTVYSFRFDYQNFGFDSYAFHRHNIVLHAIAGVLLGYLAHFILRMSPAWSSLLSFLFLTHPVHTESLLYIVGRADPQCTDVFLFALVIYEKMIRASDREIADERKISPKSLVKTVVYLALSLVLVMISGLCKEIGFTVFGLQVILEGYYLMDYGSQRFLCACRAGAVILIGTVVIIWRFQYTQGTKIARMDPYSNPIAAHDDVWQQIISYWYVHGRYAELLVWPRFLNYDYSMNAVPLILSAKDMRLLLPAAAYVLLCIGVHFTMHQFHTFLGRASGFGLATFAVSFLPMSNILFPVGTLIAERLLYIPSVGYLLVLVACLNMLWLRLKQSNRLFLQLCLVLGILALSGFYWVRCYLRIFDWKDSETITEVDGLSQPWSGRTSFNIANLYLSRKDYDRALEAYIRSIKSDPEERDSMPLYHAGQIFIYRGDWVSAEQYLKKAVGGYFSPLTLAEEEVFHDYGMALWHVNKAPESIYNLQASIITNPNFAKGYNNLACAQVLYGLDLKNQEMINQGLGSLEKALSIAPDMALYWRNAAVLLGFIGDQAASQNAWNKFALYDPSAAVQQIPDNCVWEFYFR